MVFGRITSHFTLIRDSADIIQFKKIIMHILLIKLNLFIPNAHSLKEKRREIKSLKDRLSSRFNASVAEVDMLDSWQKSVIGVCLLSNDKSYLDKQYSLIETVVFEYAELELISADREWL